MRNFWNFRTIALSVGAISVGGMALSSMWSQKVFANNPIITEGVNIMSMNTTMKSLLGMPCDK
jgi:hypothetical protein